MYGFRKNTAMDFEGKRAPLTAEGAPPRTTGRQLFLYVFPDM